jgi:hypothetical protein
MANLFRLLSQYDQLSAVAAYARLGIDALYSKKPLNETERGTLEEAIESVEEIKNGYESSKKERIIMEELDNLNLVKLLLTHRDSKKIISQTKKTLSRLQKIKKRDYTDLITKEEYDNLMDYFDKLTDVSNDIAKKLRRIKRERESGEFSFIID